MFFHSPANLKVRRTSKKENLHSRGFTILEFLVAITIGGVILTSVLVSQARYNDAASLKAVVNDISLTLRQAQIYGISVKEFTPNSNDFSAAYGLSFNSSFPTSYIYFGDRGTKDGVYTGSFSSCTTGGASECISLFVIPRGNTLTTMCTIATNGTETCNVGQAHFTFVRPATEAKIVAYNTSGSLIASGYKGIKMNFRSPGNKTRYITIFTTGQISVQ